jgi:hypothetical protein
LPFCLSFRAQRGTCFSREARPFCPAHPLVISTEVARLCAKQWRDPCIRPCRCRCVCCCCCVSGCHPAGICFFFCGCRCTCLCH